MAYKWGDPNHWYQLALDPKPHEKWRFQVLSPNNLGVISYSLTNPPKKWRKEGRGFPKFLGPDPPFGTYVLFLQALAAALRDAFGRAPAVSGAALEALSVAAPWALVPWHGCEDSKSVVSVD